MALWYQTGTASVTNGSLNVVGTGGEWLTRAKVGDGFTTDYNKFYVVTAVADDTHLTIFPAYSGTTDAIATYAIIPLAVTDSALAGRLADLLYRWHNRETEFTNWLAGTISGGPDSNGKYPLTDVEGNTVLVECPAWIVAVIGNPAITSAAEIVAGLEDAFTLIGPLSDEITALAAIEADITAVAGVVANITTAAGIAAYITTVAGISANITTVAGIAAAVSTVAGVAANVTAVAGVAANVTTVAGSIAAVGTVSTNIASVNTTATNIASVNTTATNIASVNTTAGAVASVGTVATNIANVNAVAANETNINAVAANASNIILVAVIDAEVAAVAAVDTEVAVVAGIDTEVVAVAAVAADVTAVAAIAGAVGSAAANAAEASDAVGAVAFRFLFDNSTTMANPGTGDIRLNHATLSSVSSISISAATADSGNPDISSFIVTWDDSTHTPRGILTLRKKGAPGTFAQYGLTGSVTDSGAWLQFSVTYIAHAGSFTNADTLYVGFVGSANDGLGVGDMLASNNLSDLANFTTARDNLGLELGVDVQVFSDKLAAIASLTWGADKILVLSGTNTLGTSSITAAGLALLDDADASAQRTTLGLGSLATLSTVNDGVWSGTDLAITNGGTGASNATDARTNLGLGSLATASTISDGNWSGTDLAVANGGTGASTAAAARTNLDVTVTWAVPTDITSASSPVTAVDRAFYRATTAGGTISIDLINITAGMRIYVVDTGEDGTFGTNSVVLTPKSGKKINGYDADDTYALNQSRRGYWIECLADGNYTVWRA